MNPVRCSPTSINIVEHHIRDTLEALHRTTDHRNLGKAYDKTTVYH